MKFTIAQSTLLKALALAGKPISSNMVMPIMETYLFEIKGGKLEITGANNEVFITQSLDVEHDGDDSVAIHGHKLIALVKEVPDQPITFEVVRGASTINVLISYDSGSTDMAVEDGNDYPKPKQDFEISLTVDRKKLSECIAKTTFAVSTDELKPALTGVRFSLDNGSANLIGCDARVLGTYSFPVSYKEKYTCIIPAKALNIIAGITADVDIAIEVGKANIKFDMGNGLVLRCRLIDEKYPDAEGVIPENHDKFLVVGRSELIGSLRRVVVFADSTKLIRFDLTDDLIVAAQNIDFGQKSSEKLSVTYDGEPISIGMNCTQVLNILSRLDTENVYVSFSTPAKAVLFREENKKGKSNLMLAMPLTLNN